MTPGPARYVRAEDAILKQVGETQAVYVRSRRALHVLNPSARLLYDCLEEPRSLRELAELLSQTTRAELATVRRDLEETLPDFVRRGVVACVE